MQSPSPSQFKLVSRYRSFWYNLRSQSYPQKLFSCDCISSLVGHILIWRKRFPEVRSEVYNKKGNSSGKILAGTNIIFPGAILPVLQPVLCCQGYTALPLFTANSFESPQSRVYNEAPAMGMKYSNVSTTEDFIISPKEQSHLFLWPRVTHSCRNFLLPLVICLLM